MNEEKDLYEISKAQLMKECIEVYDVLNSLVYIDKSVANNISLSLITFIVFITDGIIKLNPDNDKVIKNYMGMSNENFKRIINKVRIGHKLLSDKKTSRISNKIESVQEFNYNNLVKDYKIIQRLFIKLFGQEDYGVFYFEDTEFGTTIQYPLYIDDVLSKNTLNDGEKLLNLAKSTSHIIKNYIDINLKPYRIIFNIENNKAINKDKFGFKDYFLFDSKRKNIFNNNLDPLTQATLHSHLCQLNFLKYVFPYIFGENKDCLFRFRFIAFLESIKMTEKIMNNKNESKKYFEILEELHLSKTYKILSKGSVRNNIAHYLIKGYKVNIFTTSSAIRSIIEYESDENFENFYERFQKDYYKLQGLLYELLF